MRNCKYTRGLIAYQFLMLTASPSIGQLPRASVIAPVAGGTLRGPVIRPSAVTNYAAIFASEHPSTPDGHAGLSIPPPQTRAEWDAGLRDWGFVGLLVGAAVGAIDASTIKPAEGQRSNGFRELNSLILVPIWSIAGLTSGMFAYLVSHRRPDHGMRRAPNSGLTPDS